MRVKSRFWISACSGIQGSGWQEMKQRETKGIRVKQHEKSCCTNSYNSFTVLFLTAECSRRGPVPARGRDLQRGQPAQRDLR